MKALCFILLSVACVALMPGTLYAASAGEPEHQQTKNEPAHPAGHSRVLDKNHPHAPLGLAKASLPSVAAKNSNRSKSEVPRRSPGGPASTVSLAPAMPPNSTPHHGPNPARVDGATIPKVRNSGTVNGTGVRAKP